MHSDGRGRAPARLSKTRPAPATNRRAAEDERVAH